MLMEKLQHNCYANYGSPELTSELQKLQQTFIFFFVYLRMSVFILNTKHPVRSWIVYTRLPEKYGSAGWQFAWSKTLVLATFL